MRQAVTVLGSALLLLAIVPATAPAQETRYQVALEGVSDDSLRQLLRDVSRLITLTERPPPSLIGLRRRAEEDRVRLQTALRSEGFYSALVSVNVAADLTPAQVLIQIDPGPRTMLGAVRVITADGAALPDDTIPPAALGLTLDAAARAPIVNEGGSKLLLLLARRGYAFARLVDTPVTVDHGTHRMDVTYVVDPGPMVQFGPINVAGLVDVADTAVRQRLPFQTGDRFDPVLLERGRLALSALDVFDTVRLELGTQKSDAPDAEGQVPVSVTLGEKPARFVGFGATYATQDGASANAFWGHRNAMGRAERFRVAAQIGGIGRDGATEPGDFDYRLGTSLLVRDFWQTGQTLTLTTDLVSERPDAYRRDALVASALLQRDFAKGLAASLGVTIEQARVMGAQRLIEGQDGAFTLRQTTDETSIGFPATVSFSRTDDPLDPSRGFKLSLAATPWIPVLGDLGPYAILRAGGSSYANLATDWVAAVRGTFGVVVSDGVFAIPADKRFFAGGGGSVRGYGYQKIGPKDALGTPQGGLSLTELSGEIRWRVSADVGLVAFLDGGVVSDKAYPDAGSGLQWGTGVGGRYFTAIGPIRLDVGVPLNRDQDDASWALYISLGQAF